MTHADYLEILFNGLSNHSEFLPDHFYREYKKASANDISVLEFFKRLNDAVLSIMEEFKKIYHEELKDYQHLKALDEKLPVENRYNYPKPDMNGFGLSVSTLTKGKYYNPSHLYVAHLEAISKALNEALERVKRETDRKDDEEENKNTDKITQLQNSMNTTEKLVNKLKQAGALSRSEVNEIQAYKAEQLQSFSDEFYQSIGSNKEGYFAYEIQLIERLLMPAIVWKEWDSYSEGQKKSKVIKLQTELFLVQEMLRSISVTIKQKYLHQTPLTVDSYIQYWELFFEELTGACMRYGYFFKASLYYPIIEIWLQEVKEEFSINKLQAKNEFIKQYAKQVRETNDDASEKNKEHTTARQVLAIHFLLKYCAINPIDRPTPVAKFVQFLTGRELNAKRIQDTTVYKNVKSPFKLNDEELIKDLEYIKPFFDAMGLEGIKAEIDKEIRNSKT